MRIEGSMLFQAPRDQVYRVFTDKDVLARATPGIQSMTEVAPDRYEAVMKVGVAGISGTYKGTLELKEKRPAEQYTLEIAGQGSPGFVSGTGVFVFADSGQATAVTYAWELQVGGLAAGVGQRVLGGVGKMMIGQFMNAMASELKRPVP